VVFVFFVRLRDLRDFVVATDAGLIQVEAITP